MWTQRPRRRLFGADEEDFRTPPFAEEEDRLDPGFFIRAPDNPRFDPGFFIRAPDNPRFDPGFNLLMKGDTTAPTSSRGIVPNIDIGRPPMVLAEPDRGLTPPTRGLPGTSPDTYPPGRPTPLVNSPVRLPAGVRPREAPQIMAALDSSAQGLDATTRSQPTEGLMLDYRNQPINDAIGFERNQYVREKQKLDAQGRFAGVKRNWKDSLLGGLSGFVAGMGSGQPNAAAGGLGGFAAGLLGTAIAPTRGRENLFHTMEEPRLARDQARVQAEEDRRLKVKRQQAEIERIQGSTKDSDLERRYKESQIKRNEAYGQLSAARAQAAAMGRPVLTDIQTEDGRIVKAQVHPNGDVIPLGASGTAAIAQDRIEARKDIAGQQITSRENIANQQITSREKMAGQQEQGRNQRAAKAPAVVGQAANHASQLKAQAEAQWQAAKTYPEGSPDYQKWAAAARASQAEYNSYAKSMGQQYPDYFEVGEGQGWAYINPRTQGRGIVPGSSSAPSGSTMKLSDAKKLLQ